MAVLVTGGLGYIGSHTCVALLQSGRDVVILDNLSNSVAVVADRIATIAGRKPVFVQGDILDGGLLDAVLQRHAIDAVIHFAAAKSVEESVANPLKYYNNNVGGTLSVINAMARAGVRSMVFSSSCTVYGEAGGQAMPEDSPRSPTTPYGRSKAIQEDVLSDLARADSSWRFVSLRYFNPVGAHGSGLIGEDPVGVPGNLMPYLLQVAVGRRQELRVFGGDYPTPDGSCIRDFIHVQDLADGHTAALRYLDANAGHTAINLGTGKGASVLEVCAAFESATGQKLPRRVVERRAGDVAAIWSDPSLAQQLLGWRAKRDLTQMCRDAWNWQSRNPNGYC